MIRGCSFTWFCTLLRPRFTTQTCSILSTKHHKHHLVCYVVLFRVQKKLSYSIYNIDPLSTWPCPAACSLHVMYLRRNSSVSARTGLAQRAGAYNTVGTCIPRGSGIGPTRTSKALAMTNVEAGISASSFVILRGARNVQANR